MTNGYNICPRANQGCPGALNQNQFYARCSKDYVCCPERIPITLITRIELKKPSFERISSEK